jgi:hypothetical protein
MKNFIPFLLLAFTAITVKAQVATINESFESWPATDWSTYTLGAGNGWGQDFEGIGHTGTNSAHSYINNGDCDNWLVSPQVQISTNGYQLKFWELNNDEEYYVNRTVYISTGSGDPSDGDFVAVLTFTDIPTFWMERTLDLSAYDGQNIYVAFRYEGTWHRWYIDDVTMAPTSFVDGALTAGINPTQVGNPGVEMVTLQLTNIGTSTLNDVTIEWTVNGAMQTAYSSTSLNLSAGASTNIDLGTYHFNTSGLFNIQAILATASDLDETNDTLNWSYAITTIKDGKLHGIKPEGMSPVTGVQDVSVIIENLGAYTIDTTAVEWMVDGVPQPDFNTNSLGLAPGQTIEVTIGQFNFATGVFEIEADLNVLGDIVQSNDHYLVYTAIDTFWESFEGRTFPPENWSIEFGTRDDINFDTPPHGNYYYTSSVDNNFFGEISDTLYTPLLDIEAGDQLTFRIKSSQFLPANRQLVWKNGTTGAVTLISNISSIPDVWDEVTMSISSAAGVNQIGIVSTSTGGYGDTKFDLFTSTASLHIDDNDLAVSNGDLYFLAKENQNESFDCVVKNSGAFPVLGSAYTVKLMEEPGIELASAQGVSLNTWEEGTVTINHTFSGIAQHRLYFEIEFVQDQNTSNNRGRSADVNVVPNTVIINQIGEPDQPNANIPFTANGNTQTLGEDDLSQTLYLNTDLPVTGNIYGMVYTYDNLLGAEDVKHMPLKVWLAQTGVTALSGGWVPNSELLLVYDDTLEILPGPGHEIYIPFITPINYSGLNNIVIQDYQYDPEWPPSIMRMYLSDLPQNGPTRTIGVSDYYQLDPLVHPTEFYETEDIAYTQFVIEPVIELCAVSGTVYGTANVPLAGATVSVEGAGIAVVTDSNGDYTLPDFPYGNYDLTAGVLGYNDNTISVSLSTSTFTQDFYLLERAQVNLTAMLAGSNAPSVPLENVSVSAVGYTTDNGFTNANGEVNLTNIFGVSEYAVTFSLYGYYDTTIVVTVMDQNVDMGTVLLEQEFISPFDVQVALSSGIIVQWKDPLQSDKVKIQNDYGICSYSYTNEPNEDVFLGNVFGITDTTTITSVEFRSDVYLNAIDTISIEMYDLNYNWLGSSEPFLIYPDSIHTIDVPNIVVYDSIFALIHWQNNAASTNALCLDYSDPNIPNTAVIGYPGQPIVLLSEFFGDGTPNMSFLLRLNTLDKGNNNTNNESLTYNVFRGLASEFPSLDNWEMLNASPVTSLSYTDVDWGSVDENEQYRYAVETIYTDGTSEVTFSNIIDGSLVGIEELIDIARGIRIYPVPTSAQVTLSFDEDFEITGPIEIYDALGRIIDHIDADRITNHTVTKDLSVHQNGVYFIRMQVNGQIISKSVIVTK